MFQGQRLASNDENPYFDNLLREECARRHPCTILLEICHKLKLSEPVYEFTPQLSENGESFVCKCNLKDLKCFAVGTARNKKGAKSDAATQTIELIAYIPDVQSIIMQLIMASNIADGLSFNP